MTTMASDSYPSRRRCRQLQGLLLRFVILSSIASCYCCHANSINVVVFGRRPIIHTHPRKHYFSTSLTHQLRWRWSNKLSSLHSRNSIVGVGCSIESCLTQLRGGNIDSHRTGGIISQKVHATTNYIGAKNIDNGGEVQTNQQQQTTTSTSSSSSNQKSPFEYIPITALDDYGQSTQLRHAMESANRFGTPVLACICCHYDDVNEDDMVDDGDGKKRVENAIVVCSLQRPRPGIISPTPSTNSLPITKASTGVHHPSIQGMVKLLATRDDFHHPSHYTNSQDGNNTDTILPKHALHTAIITTGIQSDASFLLERLQTHLTSKYWFRYDTLPQHSSTLVKMIREVMLDCLGYDWNEEVSAGGVSGGVGSAAPSYTENEDEEEGGGSSRAGRPLGVCTFLLGLNDSTNVSPPQLTVIKANGASQQYVAHAMGAESPLANERLSQSWRRYMSRDEARDMMGEILKDIAKERGWLDSEEDAHAARGSSEGAIHGLTVACETVTSRGIDITFSTLQ